MLPQCVMDFVRAIRVLAAPLPAQYCGGVPGAPARCARLQYGSVVMQCSKTEGEEDAGRLSQGQGRPAGRAKIDLKQKAANE